MADFVAVLRKTIDGLGENTPELRQKVYERARATIAAKIAAIQPPPPAMVIDRQTQALEDAIRVVETEFAPPPADDADDLDAVLASLDQPHGVTAAPPPYQAEPGPEAEPFVDEPDDAQDGTARHEPAAPPAVAQDAPPPSYGQADPVFADAPPVPPRDEDDDLVAVAAAPRREPPIAAVRAGEKGGAGPAARPARRSSRSYMGLIAALAVLLLLGGASYGIWLNRAEFAAMLGYDEAAPGEVAGTGPEAAPAQTGQEAAAAPETAAPPAATPEAPAATGEADSEPDAPANGEQPPKFTQRLTETGEEIDPGPAGGTPSIGEGTSVAAATQPSEAPGGPGEATPNAPATPAAQGGQQGVPVGQRAIFYEERTTMADSTAEQGSIVWSLIQESPGGDLPPEPAIRAELSIPSKEIEMRLTIRRNADATLPASHIIEMIFLTPENFAGGAVDNVLRVAFKPTEEATGMPLRGIPAKIADGYFLVALSDEQADTAANLQLLQRESWIDIPIIYTSGRRALVTMEKGIPGARVFEQAIEAWRSNAARDAG